MIPPESNIDKGSVEYRLSMNSTLLSALQNCKTIFQKNRAIRRAKNQLKCSEDELNTALKNIDKDEALDFSISSMGIDEFNALITQADFPTGADFITHHFTEEWQAYLHKEQLGGELFYAASLIDQLVAVDRLRVIEVIKGFSRTPHITEDEEEIIVPPDIVGKEDWLPAIELFGEGLFFTLNTDILKLWESNQYILLRAKKLADNYEESSVLLPEEESINAKTARFIMLHTLSHIIIRELESLAGYPAASLQERIYSDTTTDMAGILIYTAVPDVAGTLGGIIEQVKPDAFLRLFYSALQQAQWCSLDPVCGEMEEHGLAGMNHAACHGCTLVPETACMYSNVFLDRLMIIGGKIEESGKKYQFPSLVQAAIDYQEKNNG